MTRRCKENFDKKQVSISLFGSPEMLANYVVQRKTSAWRNRKCFYSRANVRDSRKARIWGAYIDSYVGQKEKKK